MTENLLIILGYGVFDKSNDIYREYIDRAIKLIDEKNPSKVIICGGYTNKNYDLSEAQSIKNYIESKAQEISSKIILEKDSLTTSQNLEFANKIIVENSIKVDSIVVTCDSIRAPKVYYLALQYLGKTLRQKITEEVIYRTLLKQFMQSKIDVTNDLELKYENMLIKGFNLKRDSKEIGNQIVATMEEIGGFKYESIEEDILAFKRREFGIE